MNINSISIKNFRCFKDYSINFGKETSIIIGKNGTGKTNLLTALVYALSFPFSQKNDEYSIANSSPDLRIAKIDNKDVDDARYDDSIADFIYPIELKGCITIGHINKEWSLKKDSKGGGLKTALYQDAFKYFNDHYLHRSNNLPILAYFSDSFPHKKIDVKSYAKDRIQSEKKIQKNFGYYMWNKETNCVDIWVKRYIFNYYQLIDADISLKNEREKEKKYVDSFLYQFTKPLNDLYKEINSEFEITDIKVQRTSLLQDARLKFSFADGRTMFFHTLPQGYNRLLSMVMDIAYRNYILNGISDPMGIVMIDEIELHLHPSLQQEVLQRLRNTFPKIQFIVTTHSALIISNFQVNENNKLIQLLSNGTELSNENLENIFGLDYTTSLTDIMGVAYRPIFIERLINTYISLKIRNKEAEAQKIWDTIFEKTGKNQRLENEINQRLKRNT